MHIKQVVIRGFKTYKDQVSLPEDLHKGVNVVVGFNGAGKSNFFNAILFVISDHFGTLRAETRKALLHEGAGPGVLTAFVEIAFDNTDRRMPLDQDEVRVRRTIAAKKDEYMLDGRRAMKQEVFNLLESCGFSKSNPYYIVQQGKISELTLMNDVRRLDLLREISGASVFDERRTESRKILDEIVVREEGISKVIDFIRQRIKSLEEEQKELMEYQKLEHRRRCLEFEMNDREWRSAQDQIVVLDRLRQESHVKLNDAQREASVFRDRLGTVEGELDQLSSLRTRLMSERKEADHQRLVCGEDLARLRLELDDEQKRAIGGERLLKENCAELEKVKVDLAAADAERVAQAAVVEQHRREWREMNQQHQLNEARRDQLLAKQCRLASYTTVAERDAALEVEIRRHQKREEECRVRLERCNGEFAAAQQQHASSEARMAELKTSVRRLQIELDQGIAKSVLEVTRKLDECSEHKRTLTQERERSQRQIDDMAREATQCQSRIDASMPRPVRNALAAVSQWAEREAKSGAIYGTLLDNIEVPAEYQIAAESTAGAALFNLLVQDDTIAAEIITEVRTRNLGSIVCTPLNRVAAAQKTYGYPPIHGVKPLVEVVKCSDLARPAMHQVFGRTLVCSSLELCDEVSRKYGFDTITTEGDKVSCRGTLSGGYQNPANFTKIKNSMKLRAAGQKRHELASKLDATCREVRQAQEGLDKLHNDRNELQNKRSEVRESLNRAVQELNHVEPKIARGKDVVTQCQERKVAIENTFREVKMTITGLREEMSSEVLGALPAAEQQELQRLSRECREQERVATAREEECHELERVLKDKEATVNGVLRKRKAKLEDEIRRGTHFDHQEHIVERDRAYKQQENDLQKASVAAASLTKELSEIDVKIGVQRETKERLRLEEGQLQERIAEADNELQSLNSMINAQAKKKHQADEKMRTMTFVSSDVAQYKSLSGRELMKEMTTTTNELSKYEHVNKKAIDQFATFQGQLEELEASQNMQRRSKEEIEKFLDVVDAQKEQTLKDTLQKVDQHFSTIFAELVDGGRGRLVMVQADGFAEDDAEGAVDAKGVRVEVSFTGQSGSTVTMAQLSGGQKTVVAIALIFAIQRLEPAPFYLFDEIDAALDTQYRTAVAKLIERDAKSAQMIITTFRPEIIDKSDRTFRVYQTNRVSSIEAVSRDVAREVIEEQARQEVIE